MTDRVVVDIADHVAQVTLNRAGKHNAVDRAMFDAILEAGTSLAGDRSVRAVVLHGAGDNFCAGIDVSLFQSEGIDPATMQPRDGSPSNLYQSAAYVWRELPVPVIAAVHGVAYGAGLQIALGADLRIAADDAELSIMEIKWGIIPDMSITITLPGLMAYDEAAELAWTGAVVSGRDAAAMGLVTRSAQDPLREARDLARRIAERSPDAIRATKRLFREAWADRDAALLRREAELQLEVMAGSNQKEAAAANIERRRPDFGDAQI